MRSLDEIDALIRQKHAAGSVPGNIAGSLGLRVGFVIGRLDAMGIEYEEGGHEPKYRVHPMWDATPGELRHAIWQRQHDGAVATLRRRA